ncbi:MAG TPA: hypothetical protein VGL66_19760 [Caulobacteraceae bacterium]|jgi:hypothetical protein
MPKLSCLCGRVSITIPRRPDYINECNCTLCSKTGARWAYFHPSEVVVEGATRSYRRSDKQAPSVDVHFCETCGVTTHFTLTDSAVAQWGNVQLGVNLRLADEKDLAGAELRFPDGLAWSGKGDFDYVRETRILGA